MERFEEIDITLRREFYTLDQLFDSIRRYYPTYKESSFRWIVGSLIKRKAITNIGFDCFVKNGNYIEFIQNEKPINNVIAKAFSINHIPVRYVTYSSNNVLRFLGEEPTLDLSIIEVEKKNLYPIYLSLQESVGSKVLLDPNEDELFGYYKEGCWILRPSPSKSPSKGNQYSLERLCVDLYKDKLLETLFPLIDLDETVTRILSKYDINLKTMLSYAERRGIKSKLLEKCYESIDKPKLELLQSTFKFPKLTED